MGLQVRDQIDDVGRADRLTLMRQVGRVHIGCHRAVTDLGLLVGLVVVEGHGRARNTAGNDVDEGLGVELALAQLGRIAFRTGVLAHTVAVPAMAAEADADPVVDVVALVDIGALEQAHIHIFGDGITHEIAGSGRSGV